MLPQWLSVLPPLVAIAVVLWRRDVIAALLLAIFTAELLLAADHWSAPGVAVLNTLERIVSVFESPGNTRLLIFSLLIGALLAYIRASGGVAAVVVAIVRKGLAKNARQAALLTSGVGTAVFVESNLSVLTAGILSRGLFDRFGLNRAKLAYIIDSTSAPVCILILFNGWGAFVLALLGDYELGASAAAVLWGSVAYNFYALVTLLVVFLTAASGRYFGPLASSPSLVEHTGDAADECQATRVRYMLAPLAVMVGGMIGFMLWTGDGDITAGSGSKSVLYATALATLLAYLQMLCSGRYAHGKLVNIGFQGMSELLPLVTILLLALALGSSLGALGTGDTIAGLVSGTLPRFLVPAVLFIAGALISFSTGTSWGTFAILIPLGMPLVAAMDLPPALLLAAILGGGVFGDHCSPISDTTAVSSIASGCDLLEHVRTQLPYALFGGGLALLMYVVTGLLLC